MARRIVYYLSDLDRSHPGVVDGVRDVYYGHTHLPIDGFEYDGLRFHNTGSAVRRGGFNMLTFDVDGSAVDED